MLSFVQVDCTMLMTAVQERMETAMWMIWWRTQRVQWTPEHRIPQRIWVVAVPLLEVPLLEVPLLEVPLLEVPLLEVPLLEVPLLEVPLLEVPLPPSLMDLYLTAMSPMSTLVHLGKVSFATFVIPFRCADFGTERHGCIFLCWSYRCKQWREHCYW
jgi:hypothetical protein